MIVKPQVVRRLIALACVLFAPTYSSHARTPKMPFSKGTIWVYEGEVAWQVVAEVKSKRVRLTTEILDTFSHPGTRVAVARGFPSELTWYGDHRHPQYSVLVLTRAGLFEIGAEGEQDARDLARDRGRLRRDLKSNAYELVPFPLSGGRPFRSGVRGLRPAVPLRSYRSIYRTNPDHTIVDFAPGLGVVRYVYEHHGTVSSVDVRLREISFRGGEIKVRVGVRTSHRRASDQSSSSFRLSPLER